MSGTRIYLDQAATSWPKSDDTLAAMDRYARQCGAAAGRGNYRSATHADAIIAATRREIARQIHAPSGQCISLHSSGTAALNAAIHGLLREGDHVVTTAAEHNSVLRPLHHLQQHAGVDLTIVDCDDVGRVSAERVLAAVVDRTRLVAVTHASNVTGVIQPIDVIAERLRSHHALLLCDAAQTFGYLPIDVSKTAVDLLAAPGHKGSGGPLGTGFLYAHPQCQPLIRATIQGGTGSDSESLEMPFDYPAKLEAGNLNVPALAGWKAALESEPSIASVSKHCRQIAGRLHDRLGRIEGLRVYGEPGDLPVVSVTAADLSPADLAAILDAEYGIETRAGLHCAGLIHQAVGSSPLGTLRISAGAPTTIAEVDAVVDALAEVLQMVTVEPEPRI